MTWAALLWWTACGGEAPPAPPPSTNTTEEACGSEMTWNGVGQGFLLSYCTACHAETVQGGLRYGAPEGIDFDSLTSTRTWDERIRVRTVETQDMPPAGGPSDTERELFAAWLDCGLPGRENPLPASSNPEILVAGYTLLVSSEEDAGVTTVTRIIDSADTANPSGLLRIDHYAITPFTADFLGYQTYDSGGEELLSVQWSPPLKLLSSDLQETTAIWQTSTEEGETAQTWVTETDDTPEIDGHVLDPDSWELTLTEDNGEQHGWVLSDNDGVVAQWALRETDLVEFQQLSTGASGTTDSEFPLMVDQPWLERALVVEVAP